MFGDDDYPDLFDIDHQTDRDLYDDYDYSDERRAPMTMVQRERATMTAMSRGHETPYEYELRQRVNQVNAHQSAVRKEKVAEKKVDDEIPKTEKPSVEFRIQLQQARSARGMSQKDLAQRLNIKVQDLQGYESGKVMPSKAIIGKMRRILKM